MRDMGQFSHPAGTRESVNSLVLFHFLLRYISHKVSVLVFLSDFLGRGGYLL